MESAANLGVVMGKPLQEPLKKVAQFTNRVTDALRGAPKPIQNMVTGFATLTGGLLTAGGGLAYGTSKVLEMGAAFSKAGLSLPKFATGLGLVGLAIGAGLLAYETNFLGFGDFVDEKMEQAGEAVQKFGDLFDEAFFENRNAEMNDLAAGIAAVGYALDGAFGTDVGKRLRNLAEGIDVLTDSFEAGQKAGIDPWVNGLESAAKAAREMDNEQLARELHTLSGAWQAMADNMAETEGTMPELNRQLSALQHGLGYVLGPQGLGAVDDAEEVPSFFDELNTNAAKAQDDLTKLKNTIGAADWGSVWDQLTAFDDTHAQPLPDFFANLRSEMLRTGDDIGPFLNNLGTLKDALMASDWQTIGDDLTKGIDITGGLQNITDGLQDWFQDTSDLLMGREFNWSGGPGEREATKGLVQQLGDSLGQSFAGLGDQVMQALPDENPFDAVGTWLQDSLDEVGRFFMPQEMPAGLGGAGMGDTSGISQWFSGMVDGIGAGMDQAVADLGALAEEKKTGFKNALGDFFGPIGQFLFPAPDASGKELNTLGDPGEIGKQFGESLLNTFKDPAFADALQSSVDAMPAEALQATGVALMGALNKGLGSALTQPVEGGDAGQTMGTQMIQTLADGLTSSLQADGAADLLIPAVNAFGTAFNSTLGKAMTSTIMPKGQTDMVGEEAAGGIGGKLVQSLADGLTTSLQTEGTAEKFIPAVNALGTVLNSAMQTASEGASQAGDPAQQDQQAASGFGQQMVQGLATGLANGITAAPPEMFIPVTNALGTQLGAAMSQAAQQAQPPGGVGPVNPQVGDAGLSMVQGLTQGLTDSITAAPPETFYPVANALGSQLGTALNDAMTKTVGVGENTTGGMVGADAAGGIGAQMVQNLATGLSDSITNAPEEVFTPVGAALGTKMTQALQTAVEGGAQGGAGADGATGVGQQMGEAVGQMLISGVEQAD